MAIEHVEIGVQEVETAKTFYGDLCGWTFQDYGERYSSFSHGAGHGGLNRVAPGSGGYVLPVLYAHELEAALDRVRQCRARGSRPPFDIPGGGADSSFWIPTATKSQSGPTMRDPAEPWTTNALP